MESMDAPAIASALTYLAVIAVFVCFPFSRIFRRAGRSPWLALLMLLPLINLVTLWCLAFSKWPIARERQPLWDGCLPRSAATCLVDLITERESAASDLFARSEKADTETERRALFKQAEAASNDAAEWEDFQERLERAGLIAD